VRKRRGAGKKVHAVLPRGLGVSRAINKENPADVLASNLLGGSGHVRRGKRARKLTDKRKKNLQLLEASKRAGGWGGGHGGWGKGGDPTNESIASGKRT